ncbi:hypothetical protein V0288_19800 [Pannus brasiliensis CCIBt3594]|uniref:Uncharacterized protein n=1 Tax=Pannus brasiliensis CCIBt3594 TaxID=1427578 RepID=A0AAW9QYQ7_9CHRO
MNATLALAPSPSAELATIETVENLYEIVHATIGRVRIRVPRLASDRDYANKLEHCLRALVAVTEVRVNPFAESVIVNHDDSLVLDSLFATIERADSWISPPDFPFADGENESFPDGSIEEAIRSIADALKNLLKTGASLSMTVGMAGLILPLVPGTPFLLLSFLCYFLESCLPE